MNEVKNFSLAISAAQVPENSVGPWTEILGPKKTKQAWELLHELYSGIEVDFVKKLRECIFSHQDLSLSILPYGEQWLTFKKQKNEIHLPSPPLTSIPDKARQLFPFDKVEGLDCFLRYFGGMANWNLPPCPYFLPIDDDPVIASEKTMEEYVWGTIETWEGSLCLYRSCGGDALVVSPDNRVGLWDHEYCWVTVDDAESPWQDLEMNFEELITLFTKNRNMNIDESDNFPFY